MDRPRTEIESEFAAALERYRSGAIGTPLQAGYPPHERTEMARTFWGDAMEIVLPELVSCELDTYGLIEPGLTRVFLERVGPGMTVFDVGAHLGYYTLLALRLGASVYAFEPSSETFARLERNVGGAARLERCGVWSETTELELRDFGARHSAVNSFFAPKDEGLGAPVSRETVPVTSIDEHVATVGTAPDLIKIDAEGAEVYVLDGARRTIAAHHPIITIEVGDVEGTPRSREAVDLAIELGYEIKELTLERTIPHAPRDDYSYGNLVLVPPDGEGVASSSGG